MLQDYIDYIEKPENVCNDIQETAITLLGNVSVEEVANSRIEKNVVGLFYGWNFEYVEDLFDRLSQDDFLYIEQRYNSSNTVLGKALYGVVLFYAQMTPMSKRKDFKLEVADNLLALAHGYWSIINQDDGHKFYFMSYQKYLHLALKIYLIIKETAKAEAIRDEIINKHLNWDCTSRDTNRAICDFTHIISENFALFKICISYPDIERKNLQASDELSKDNNLTALNPVAATLVLAQKLNEDKTPLLKQRAKLYESEAKNRDGLAAAVFADQARRVYKALGDVAKFDEISAFYDKKASEAQTQSFYTEIPKEYINCLSSTIKDLVDRSNNSTIVENIALQPWFPTADDLKEQAEKMANHSNVDVLENTALLDKYGNITNTYYQEGEYLDMHFWQSFSLQYQIGLIKLQMYFNESIKSNKLNYENLIDYLSATWYGEEMEMHYVHGDVKIRILDVLKPALKVFFEEMKRSQTETQSSVDFMLVTDSLSTKIEYILRYYLIKNGFSTTAPRQKGAKQVVMQILLDEIIANLKDSPQNPTGFSEEDRVFVKYICTPVGENLRNRVAHGLMDSYEYMFPQAFSLFYLIVRLSRYKF